ncbi:Bro-N domain-containing protein [Salipaludibacillus sp. CUR1]|uniref:BRO-N domain-containing protein n=1 Tax=Salipaludibacillus sp. CUR1 TaxID=2820003 RepID=UPI001E652FC4|nr:Bro-N domain-containing protein [Salipaludibacillus sp. CUR1]
MEEELLGKTFRVYGSEQEPLFLAKDVAEWIEYGAKNSYRILETIDIDEKVKATSPSFGVVRETWFLTEYGLYEVDNDEKLTSLILTSGQNRSYSSLSTVSMRELR